MNDTPIRTPEEQAAVDAMRLELELETRGFDTWLAQPIDDPSANRWEARRG